MSASFPRIALRLPSFMKAIVLGLTLVPAAFPSPAAESIAVAVDQAKLIRLPERVATIVVGNPLIADVSLQPGGMMVVTGKGYGATNVMALDQRGDVLIDQVAYMLRTGFDTLKVTHAVTLTRLAGHNLHDTPVYYQPGRGSHTKAGTYSWRRVPDTRS